MTDFQIIHNIFLPQAAANERMERARQGLPPEADPDELDAPSEPPSKKMMMATMMGLLGMTAEQAEREYESQKKMNENRKK